MNAPVTGGPASPARLRKILVVIVVVCSILGALGYLYGGWLLEHPPTKEQVRPGH